MIETVHYPPGKSSRAPAGDPWEEFRDFLNLAGAEGLHATGGPQPPHGRPPELDGPLLEHAGRVAWRNSTRCIGRLFWRSLVVRDLRHATSDEEVFAGCIEHLRIATNGGRIRPVLTVFPGASDGKAEPRILNHQLIRYAGYDLGGGKILGDPQNEPFTRFAMRSGWRPPATPGPFDLLPLAIRLPGKPVRWYELPGQEVLEVPIRHPKFPWFETLEMKWHAVPLITDMCFAAAGARYTCAPFSGWYMGTEIGARNLGDVKRYNMLPKIAARMGLPTDRREMLWKDRVLIELNEAVIHSFAREGVTLVDHHNASMQFMRFANRETRSGRQVRGDWSWLVPPVSGSTSPIFHTSLDPRPELPNFFYQDAVWEDN